MRNNSEARVWQTPPVRRLSIDRVLGRASKGTLLLLIPWLGACLATVPSLQMQSEVNLPVPTSTAELPGPERLTRESRGEKYEMTPRSLISLTFGLQPDIRSSYQRFKSEEARYDFFFTSRDSLTPQLRLSNTAGESRAGEQVTRERSHSVELGIEKRFFDTTELDVAVGFGSDALDEAIGDQPFLSARLRQPLGASREKLERASEDIFRRNELNDAQLGYIQEVRNRLQNAMFRFYEVTHMERVVEITTRWLSDLETLKERVEAVQGREVSMDRQRVQAEIARVSSEVRNRTGRYEIQFARLKRACGLPFHTELVLVEEPFNPFTQGSHEQWMHISIESDPEIATLQNEVRNAEVQLDLARRGTWDIALLLDGKSSLEGRGEREGQSDWSVSVGLEVSHVDPRVTDSLARQAQARINRFKQAIIARENAIFVETLEPLIRIETLGDSKKELSGNLPKFVEDYRNGVAEYFAGRLNIDDLLKRRENVFDQEDEISRLTFIVGANVAELCAATGKFFELLEGQSRN